MIERELHAEVNSSGAIDFVFIPPPGVNFSEVRVPFPGIRSHEEEIDLVESVGIAVQEACGSTACGAQASVHAVPNHQSPDTRKVKECKFICGADICPLQRPPDAGDPEPRQPMPDPPALSVELDEPSASELAMI